TRATAAVPVHRPPQATYVTHRTHVSCITRTPSTHLACSAPLPPNCQANWLHQVPRNPYLLSSALHTSNCAKMAHSRPPVGYGGSMVGARRGNGGGKVGLRYHRGASLVCHFGTKPPARSDCQSAIATLKAPVLLALRLSGWRRWISAGRRCCRCPWSG